jgi:hypothetical protein
MNATPEGIHIIDIIGNFVDVVYGATHVLMPYHLIQKNKSTWKPSHLPYQHKRYLEKLIKSQDVAERQRIEIMCKKMQ